MGESKGAFDGDIEHFAADLRAFRAPKTRIDRVIVAMEEPSRIDAGSRTP